MGKYIGKLNLSEKERAVLQEAYRTTSNRRIAQRIQCVLLKARGMKSWEIKEVVLLSENQISHWVHTYVQEGLEGLMAWRYKGKQCALDESQQAILKQALEQRLFSKAVEVKAYVSETLHQTYSIRAIQYLLKRLGYSFKKTKRLPGKRPDLEAQAAFKKNTSSSELS